MSIFSRIRDAIFNRKTPDAGASSGTTPSTSTSPSAPATSQGPASAPAVASSQPASMSQVDVEVVLTRLSESAGQKLNWRTSIVDLMKLVGMESSLEERRELAKELGYSGSLTDTASMNMWLHRQVMKKLAENGGKVPAVLLD